MKTRMIKSLWGMETPHSLEEKFRQIRDAGYEGVEYSSMDLDPGAVRELASKYGLLVIAQVFAATLEEFVGAMKRIAPFRPLLVSSQSGRDRMSFEEGCEFFRVAIDVEKDVGISVAHETHRYRLFYSPWVTRPYLEAFPDLHVLADFSHWNVVCESSLDDADAVLDLASSRTIHIHGRIGFEEGPQVSDPRAPEFAAYVDRYERWWDRIRLYRERSGADQLTFTPEYGPPAYLPTLPYSREPVADLWEVCLWGANRMRERWKS